ncbi:endolytic transglycosylase MltG [Candidatus Curtissbacteria bacterium]|nr:endolytic transglycosylase MltG [Candidatus Curtissbacteria bacterium]
MPQGKFRGGTIKNKTKFIVIGVIFIILVVTPIALNKYYNYLLAARSTSQSEDTIFIVRPGEAVTNIASNLKNEGLIKSPLAFRLLVSQMGIAKSIQAGDFRLSASMTSRRIAEELTHGAIDVWITIPEGLRLEEQAAKIEEKLNFGNSILAFDKKEYIKNAKEGYMFPDTYLIPKDASTTDVINRLSETFAIKTEKLLKSKNKTNLAEDEIIILASLIEREAKNDDERPVIAGILLNRIKSNLALQVDATVQYAKGYDSSQNTWWPQVSTDDYQKVKSPYNTYLSLGLPPGPICNPGIKSIEAALNPTQTEYYYYLHDTEGKIHYAETIDEHNENIRNFL